jgi:hypothetical protein
MKPERYHSGPLAWCLILAGTCLLLFLFQKILWLVVPFLFGLIIYYLLFPLQQRLVLGGMTRDSASATVSGADESAFFGSALPADLLEAGTNILAVEVHQVNDTSSDISFDLELRAATAAGTWRWRHRW